jgi:hypothetical protein
LARFANLSVHRTDKLGDCFIDQHIDYADLEGRFAAKLSQEQETITALVTANISSGERQRLALVHRLEASGIGKLLKRRNADGQADLISFVESFIVLGARAILLSGSQRAGDFLNNQLRGQWAERVARSMEINNTTLLRFGPSGAAMPGEEDHREVTTTFRLIVLIEGKRPDLIAFRSDTWAELPDAGKNRVVTWPNRPLDESDRAIAKRALCGIEVKNSTWHYERRRLSGGGWLAVTVKEEELSDLRRWSDDNGLPLLFLQVLFDEMYCMSFRRMLQAISVGYIYQPGDYLRDSETGAGGKSYHRFFLADSTHLCGKVVFPSDSKAEIRVLQDGNVVPYIDYRPAKATSVVSTVFYRELDFERGVT